VRILIADDDPSMRAIPAMLLRKWGHQVIEAADGKTAWEILERDPIPLVVSDWMMPEMTGLDLCRKIRASGGPNYTYFILCTSRGEKEDLIEGMDAGADDFLVKPINKEELRVRVRAGQRVLDLERSLEDRNTELSASNDQLRAAYQQIEEDLKAAAGMQTSLLPSPCSFTLGVRSEWRFKPASYVAGDIFNVFPIDQRQVGFYMLDVSGHGVPAAMLSMTLHAVLTANTSEGSPLKRLNRATGVYEVTPPAEAAGALNCRFQSKDDRYFTMVYGVLDTESGRLRLTQAGHPNPVLIQNGSDLKVLGEGGAPIGLWPDMQYDAIEAQLHPGDRLVLYSDGIVECANGQGAPFGEDRLLRYLRNASLKPLDQLLAGLETEMEDWHGSAEFDDDVSLLALELAHKEEG
jgi:sigma-B regulation protein RsbU (phosphoserine phosphatase)